MRRLAALLACLALSRAAEADDVDAARARARDLAKQGDDAFAVGRCDRAIPLWKSADAAFHAPTILLRIARCQALLAKVVAATDTLTRIVDEKLPDDAPEPFRRAQQEAKADLPAVHARIAYLTVDVDSAPGVTTTLEVDGQPATIGKELRLDGGPHPIRVKSQHDTIEQTVSLQEGERRTLHVATTIEIVHAPPPTQRTVGYVLGAVGMATMAVGGVFGWSASTSARELGNLCGPDRKQCPADKQAQIDHLRRDALIADIALVSGAGLFVTGAVVLLTAPMPKRDEQRVRLAPFGTSGLKLVGTF